MKSPYMMAVYAVTKLVDGQFPAHYDSSLRRQIQIVLAVTTAGMTSAAILVPDSAFNAASLSRITLASLLNAPFYSQVATAFSVLCIPAILYIAHYRKQSIERHVLQTNYNRVLSSDHGTDVTEDTLTIYAFLKVYAALFLLTFIPHGLTVLAPTVTGFQRLKYALYPINTYYIAILIDFGLLIGVRWAKGMFSNDLDTPASDTSGSR